MAPKSYTECVSLRITQTGALRTDILTLDAPLLLQLDGQERVALEPGTQIMVIRHDGRSYDFLERLLDGMELGLHAGYSARVDGSPIRTVYDIRLLDPRKFVVGDVVPF